MAKPNYKFEKRKKELAKKKKKEEKKQRKLAKKADFFDGDGSGEERESEEG
ncbi:hypothetical protein [uncultured Pseudodesulfovibrio sp.]|uniref:hypothetical protein n=1 Tax=uncultured Pseudodesulfovibrio sp. TaxID=2035858 RepID=UPI0029C6D00E|nr:hypothetical protein [uncultured Pseudodesulfovibrio sp.]